MYILAFFVKNKVPVGAWVYFWAFYLVPLVSISVLVPVSYSLDDYIFVVWAEISKPAPFFLKTDLSIQGLLCFPYEL